jgi:leucine dehydrogenase
MRHAVRRRLERDLSECTVAVQGVGCVGAALAQLLHDAGARLVVADVDAEAAARTAVAVGADVASVASILGCDADVVAPCAVGGVLNQRTIPKLRAKVVCGAASNQLHAVDDGDRLAARGILYAPDFVANAGGIIRGGSAYLNWPDAAVTGRVERIPHRLAEIFDLAERHGVTPEHAAEQLACEVIAAGAHASRRAA